MPTRKNKDITRIVNRVNKSSADFVNRLKNPNRLSIPDWEDSRYIATHKLGVGTDNNGQIFIYPNVQNINGKLIDFTNPKFGKWDAMDSAIERGDTVHVDNIQDGLDFTENYKRYYPKGKSFKCGGRRKAQLGLDILEGGIAIPIAPNMYYMDGRSHDNGGIAIGPNNKNGLEVEGGEVVKVGNNDIKVFSSVPLLRGVSPAQLVLGGANPNKVFKAQEEFKDRNRINDDGTRYEVGGEKIYTPSKVIQRQLQETGKVTIGGAPTIGGLRTFGYLRGLANAAKYGNAATNIFRAGKELIKRGTEKLVDSGKITRNVAQIPRSVYSQFVGVNGQNLPRTINLFTDNEKKAGGIYIKPSKRGTFTAAASKHNMGVQEFASKVLANKEDYSPAMVKKANFARNASRWKKEYGGEDDTKTAALKRLKAKHTIKGIYGGGESGGAGAGSVIMEMPEYITDTITKRYLIPVTQNFNDAFGDAVNAGLDKFMFDKKWYTTEKGNNPNNNAAGATRTQTVYLPVEHKEVRRRKKEYGGEGKDKYGNYEPKRNEKGQVVLNPNNPQDVVWLREQQGKRGAKAVHKGQQEFIEGVLNRTTPIMLGIAATNPLTTGLSLAGAYALGKAGEYGANLYKDLTGEDYTKEGKVIGQTIGGLVGSPIGKLFGKQVGEAWNAFKLNRLNSTQTLVDVPETGLTIRRPVNIKASPKQIEQTNTQKYLPTEVENLTWKEPKALLETEAQVTRRDLKNFNRWAKLFGYEPVPLRYAETKSIADRHVQDRIIQHNTFLRGVAKPNKLQRQAIEYELSKEGINNPTEYDVYTYMATHSATTTGAGRADLRPIQVRKHKVGNFNLSKTSDSPIGALYTQGSGRGAAGYAGLGPMSGGHRRTGVVVEVARPTNFRPGASYAEWVKENDFNFGDDISRSWHKNIANRIVETGKSPESYNLPSERKQELFNKAKNYIANEEVPTYDIIDNALGYIKTQHPNKLKYTTQLGEPAFNMMTKSEKKAYKEYLGSMMIGNPKRISFADYIKKENNKFNKKFKAYIIRESKKYKNDWLLDKSDYNPEDYTQPDYSVLKATTRNKGNAQQHYIFRAPIGEKILEGRGFYMPTEEEIINATTDHYAPWTPGYSRNTRKYGGVKKFKYGGNMIYTINGNVKNGLMSARPKAKMGKEEKIDDKTKIGEDGLIYKRGADGNWYTDGTIHASRRKITSNKNIKQHSSKSSTPTTLKKVNFTSPLIQGERKKIGNLYYEQTEDGQWKPAANQSSVTTKNSGKPVDFGMTRVGINHPNGKYTYHPLTGEKINADGTIETEEPSVKSVTKVSSKKSTSLTPRRGESKSAVTTKSKTEPAYINYTPNKVNLAVKADNSTSRTLTKIDTPSTGDGIQSKDGRWVGQYKTTNVGDWIGLGSNLAGSVASYFMTKSAIDKIPEPLKPIMVQPVKLKTKYNIEPQLTNVREAEQMNRASVRRNTQSSNTSLAREQRLMNEARGARNTLYGQKENIETQLINQDRLNRQSVMRDSVKAYNEYLNKLTATKTAQNQLKVSNINNLISGLTGSVNNILGNIESRRATNNTLRAIAAANPNVDARLIGGFDYYIDPITKKKYNKNQQYVGTING